MSEEIAQPYDKDQFIKMLLYLLHEQGVSDEEIMRAAYKIGQAATKNAD